MVAKLGMCLRLYVLVAMLFALLPVGTVAAASAPKPATGDARAQRVKQAPRAITGKDKRVSDPSGTVKAQMEARLRKLGPQAPRANPGQTVLFGKVVSVGAGKAVMQQTSFTANTKPGRDPVRGRQGGRQAWLERNSDHRRAHVSAVGRWQEGSA